jgi:acyl-phosphate glycerol 3-phosphate acyltransferase
VLAVDYLKRWVGCGWVPIWVGWLLGGDGRVDEAPGESLFLVAGVSAILGHVYTCWLRFRGGKGIATSAGVLTALLPWPFLIGLVVWLVVFGVWRYVSLASVSAAATLPVAVWVTGGSVTWILTTAGLAGLAIYKHRSNLGRLRAGTEPRVQWRRGKPGS